MASPEAAVVAENRPRRTRTRRARNAGFTVKDQLTVKTPRETSEVIAAARRLMTASGRRVGSGDVDALSELAGLQIVAMGVTRLAVTRLREDHGFSWAEIALRLGVSKQAAQQQYGKP